MEIYVENLLNPEEKIKIPEDKTIVFVNSNGSFRIKFEEGKIYINKLSEESYSRIKVIPITSNAILIE